MPVLPAVPSTIVPPGSSSPRFSASRMMYRAARSLTDPPGLRNSALPRISQPVSSEGPRRRMSGVLPMAPMKPSRISMLPLRRSALDGDDVRLDLGVDGAAPEAPGDRLRRDVGRLAEPRGVACLDLVT